MNELPPGLDCLAIKLEDTTCGSTPIEPSPRPGGHDRPTCFEAILGNPKRLGALFRTGLQEVSSSAPFDRLTRLASQLVRAPIAIISLMDADRVIVLSRNKPAHLTVEGAEASFPPLIGRLLIESGEPLIINDARNHPLFERAPDSGERTGVAFAAIPLNTEDGQTLGYFCMIDFAARTWLPGEIGVLSELAAIALTEISLHQCKRELSVMETKLRRKNRLEIAGNLSLGVSHELRNILCSIAGNTDLALQVIEQADPGRPFVEEVRKAQRRAFDLVQNALGLGSSPASQRRSQQLATVINDSARLVQAALGPNVELKVACASDAPEVLANATQIEQVILNLVINAKHALENKPGQISIALEAITLDERHSKEIDLAAGRYARITIADSGKGMDPTTLQRAFEPFFTTKEHGHGTGLGLAIVRDIVRVHGGAVQISSCLGKGTTFTIHLPSSQTF